MGVDVEDDGVIDDVRRGSSNLVGKLDDLISHYVEICEFLASELLRELSPRLDTLGLMVKTELKWASSDKTIASRQTVETDDGLKDGGLARTLRSEHSDSWKFDELLNTDVSQVIDDADKLLELSVHESVRVARLR